MFRQAPSFPYHDLGIVEDGTTASRAISKDAYVIWKGSSYFASTDILQGATLEEDVNLTAIPDGVINGVVNTANSNLCGYIDVSRILLEGQNKSETWVATENAWAYVGGTGDGSSGQTIGYIDDVPVFRASAYGNQFNSAFFPIKKGQTLKIVRSGNTNNSFAVYAMLH